MINSLRGRLFISLTTIVLVTGLIGGVFAHRWAFDEAIETQDSVLIQIAGLVQSGGFTGAQDLHGVDENSEVWLMELGRAPQGTPEERQLWRLQDGMRDATRQGKPVRVVLKTRSDGSRFAVAQSTGVRDEIASDMALRTVLPIAALIPCLMLVIAFVIAGSLRPMVRLADELNARRADDMTALPLRDLPSELNPFVSSINGLLQRMHEMIGQQRRFIADAAHELRTPLTALSVQAENLDHVELPPAARERLAALRQGMSRSKHLLEQLLALARHDAESTDCGQWEVVELDLAAKSVIADLLREAISRGVDLGFERAESAPVCGEPVMLAAMMLPASLPTIRVVDAAIGHRATFLLAFAATWSVFGLFAFGGDFILHHVVDATPWLAARPWLIEAGVLGMAGFYQLSPFKRRSLAACRHPVDLLATQTHRSRAFDLGVAHAVDCLGSSWAARRRAL